EALRHLAQLVPVHLIASTGYTHVDSSLESVSRVETELVRGIGESGILPGLAMSSADTRVAPAIARVAVAAGVPVMVTAANPRSAFQAINAIAVEGGEPSRTIVGGFTDDFSLDLARELAETGVFVSIDRVGHGDSEADRARARLVVELNNLGFGDQVLISQRLGSPGEFVSRGGTPGWIHLLERFAIQILEAGGDGALVRQLLVDNQAKALTVLPPTAPA
ncbi:MAG TPA: hypothetical protein VD767_12225, partial [Thermomicrobiales bacterium]|nr:hypothetical protein [Thermomicrobiales bacterium]